MTFENASPITPLSSGYASLWRRFFALCIDAIILASLSAVAGMIIPIVGSLAIWFFYAPVLESSPVRATLGKYLLGLQVTDLNGARLTFQSALIRNLMKIVSSVILLIGFIVAMFSARKQALHDLVAETVVVNGQSQVSIADAWLENVREIFSSSDITGTGTTAFKSTTPPQAMDRSVAEELERLQVLRNSGSLSAEEFEAAKRKVLGT